MVLSIGLLALLSVDAKAEAQSDVVCGAELTSESLTAGSPASSSSFISEPNVAAVCCKVCRTGKACGDSCISQTKTCTKVSGCACDE
jgi:hypothetical protein